MVADALRRKEQNKPLELRALVLTIGLNLPVQILEAQVELPKTSMFKIQFGKLLDRLTKFAHFLPIGGETDSIGEVDVKILEGK
ncbi:hypothetical protein Tco_1336705 [Tanacetum coccineum]